MSQVDHFDIPLCMREPLLLWPRRVHFVNGKHNIAEYSKPRKQRVVLKNNAALTSRTGNGLVFEKHLTGIRHEQSGHKFYQGCLSASRKTYNRYRLSFLHRQVDVAKHINPFRTFTESDVNFLQFK